MDFKISSERYKMDIQTDNGASSRLTDPIDLDNKMRVVYRKRVESAQQFRHSVCLGDIDQSRLKTVPGTKDAGEKGSDRPTLSGMGAAMERLRSEMVSLVDQDVSFMKQMLVMNERIEEIKSRGSFYKPKSHRKYSAHVTRRIPETASDTEDSDDESDASFRGNLSKSRSLYRTTTVQNLSELFSDCDIEEKEKSQSKGQSKISRDSGYYESDICFEEYV